MSLDLSDLASHRVFLYSGNISAKIGRHFRYFSKDQIASWAFTGPSVC